METYHLQDYAVGEPADIMMYWIVKGVLVPKDLDEDTWSDLGGR